jgi:hypothetical protein
VQQNCTSICVCVADIALKSVSEKWPDVIGNYCAAGAAPTASKKIIIASHLAIVCL